MGTDDDSPTVVHWWFRRSDRERDWLAYLALALLSALSKVVADWQGLVNGPGLVQLMAVAIGPLPILLRRGHPAGALIVASVVTIGAAWMGLDTSIEITTLVVVLVSLVAADVWLSPIPIFVGVALAVNAALALESARAERPLDVGTSVFAIVGTALAVNLGVHLRRYRDALAQLSVRNDELDRLRVVEAQTAVAGERVRIAREMHDVVAHHVSAILVRCRAAEHVMARQPDEAAKALAYAASASSETLTALGRLVGILRDPQTDARSDDEQPTVCVEPPQPTLDSISGLVERANHSGQKVVLRIHGKPAVVPAGVALTLYRVAQESLTNALRHAPGADVDLLLDWTTPGQVILTARNSLTRPPLAASAGHGLLGMRERVLLCGGTLQASPGNAEWMVSATIPVIDLPGHSQEGLPT